MVTLPPNLHSVVNHDGAVILDIPRNAISTLNPTGAFIWHRLQRGMPVRAIVSELALRTGTDEATIAFDVDAFIEDLKARQLVLSF
jgi:hypothetical protein